MKDRKEISAFLIGCEPHQLMAFKDYGADGAAAIGPDGKKYVYDAAYLDQVAAKMEAASIQKTTKQAKRAAQLLQSSYEVEPPAKPSSARTTKPGGTRKPATRSSNTSAKKAETKE